MPRVINETKTDFYQTCTLWCFSFTIEEEHDFMWGESLGDSSVQSRLWIVDYTMGVAVVWVVVRHPLLVLLTLLNDIADTLLFIFCDTGANFNNNNNDNNNNNNNNNNFTLLSFLEFFLGYLKALAASTELRLNLCICPLWHRLDANTRARPSASD